MGGPLSSTQKCTLKILLPSPPAPHMTTANAGSDAKPGATASIRLSTRMHRLLSAWKTCQEAEKYLCMDGGRMHAAAGGGWLQKEPVLQSRKAAEVYPSARYTWENTLRGNKAGEGGIARDMNLRWCWTEEGKETSCTEQERCQANTSAAWFMPQKGDAGPISSTVLMKAHKKKHGLQVFLCPPPPYPANPCLGGCNYFLAKCQQVQEIKPKTRVISEMHRREPALEPGYEISNCKATLVSLGEQLCKMPCSQPGKITTLSLHSKTSNGYGAQWTMRKHCFSQLPGLYHGAVRLWDGVHQDGIHTALIWPW